MKILKLNDICKIGSSKRIHLSDYVENGVPFYRSKEIIELSEGNPISEPLFISHEKFSEIKHKFPIPKTNDILITSVGTLGVVHLVKDPNFYFKDGNLTWLREFNENIIDIDFLFYWLNSNLFKKQILNNNIGAVQKAITIDFLKKVDISLPDIPNQQSIAAVLSALDKKIALNKQINARLEEMAKTLYDYWFVQFDFPDANGKPYKSSGGEMVFDETLKREIPKGWESVELQSCLAKVPSTVKILNKDIKDFGKYPVIDQSQDFICGFTDDEKSILNPQDAHIIFGDHTRIVKLVNFKYARGADGTQVILSNNERMPNYLFYQIINQIDLSSYGYARHFKFLKEFPIILPDKDISRKYYEIVNYFFIKIRNNIKQNHHLTQLRDFLLPMLMNGQVSVAE